MIDPFGRHITYLRVSVTDRCDFRCVYCMAEDMTFLPKAEVLSLEELERLCSAFVRRGVKKLRMTGGEPLVRKNVMSLFRGLGRHLESGALEELTLTTNGSQLAKYARELADIGVKRVNVSMDTLDATKFRELTRWGDLDQVMRGLDAAQNAGLAIKINAVALRGVNDMEFDNLIRWSHGRGMDLVLIEVMPMGEIGDQARLDQYLPLSMARADIARHFTLSETDYRTGGPARYFKVEETGGRLGFITPLTHNFCESCNRVRLTCTGTLFMCLGQEDAADLRAPLRASPSDETLDKAITEFYGNDPKVSDSYGRIVSSRHFDRLTSMLNDGTVAIGGHSDASSRYIAPTVLTDVRTDSRIMSEEIFGPLLPIIPVSSLDEAVTFITDRPHPLALYVFAEKKDDAERKAHFAAFAGALEKIALDNPDDLEAKAFLVGFAWWNKSRYGIQPTSSLAIDALARQVLDAHDLVDVDGAHDDDDRGHGLAGGRPAHLAALARDLAGDAELLADAPVPQLGEGLGHLDAQTVGEEVLLVLVGGVEPGRLVADAVTHGDDVERREVEVVGGGPSAERSEEVGDAVVRRLGLTRVAETARFGGA